MCKKIIYLCVLCAMSARADVWQPVALLSEITHTQPMTGLVFWPDNAEDHHAALGQSISLEFQYCLPCKVVTGKQNGQIQYDWSWLEAILNDIAGRGHQAVLRFRYEYPNSKDVDGKTPGMTAVPDYIKCLPGYQETYKKVSGDGPTYYADWSNAELQWFTKQFYTDFEAQYATDPRIAFLEVGFGHWSEYHIYGCKTQFGVNFPTMQYQSEFFQHLDTTMSIPWLVSIDAGDDEISPMQTDAAMQACRFGLFDDSFMHEEHDFSQGEGWNEQCWQWADPQGTRWYTGVNGGEISYYTDNDQRNFLNPSGMYGVTWEQAAAKYHITFMNANDCTEGRYATAARVTEAALACGYRFEVISAESNGTAMRLTVQNVGVAPIYYDAYFAVGNIRSTQSLKGLIPGQTLVVTIPAVGTPTIVCDHLLPSQEIQFNAQCVGMGVKCESSKAVSIVKALRDGQMYIICNGQKYSLLGAN